MTFVKLDLLITPLLILHLVLLSACTPAKESAEVVSPLNLILPLAGDPNQHKSIYVFLDGTLNDQKSQTNVWKTFQIVVGNADPQTTALYIEGVGTTQNPLFGSALGVGMEERIQKGYEFIVKNYRAGDHVFIFGFSRGAHQARSLAGLLAYAGIPVVTEANKDRLLTIANDVLDLSKRKSDEESAYQAAWSSWSPNQQPVIAAEIKRTLGEAMIPVEIKFLGVWDTVPGSSFKKYGDCKEEIGFWKKWFHWLPIISPAERYKTGSYPAIHFIAHAVSLDEKRSKFNPILLCEPINSRFTQTQEIWFPGAHADVGGGYEDSHELSDISLEWMLKHLSARYQFKQPIPTIQGSPRGLAHWSMADKPANLGSECIDRKIPKGAVIDPSAKIREQSAPVPVLINHEVEQKAYPLGCADITH